MKLRGYRKEDWGAVARVSATALGGSVEYWEKEYYDPEKNPRLDPEQVYVVEEEGEIRATAAVLPLEVFFEGRTVSMGGIAAVATHPAYRRRGYAGDLMQAALRGMRERNVHLSMLHPFAHSYYRRYGWELATEAISYDLKPTELPTSPEQKHLRAYRGRDLPRMMTLLEEWASKHPLFVRRSEGRWRQIFAREEQEATVYDVEGRVEGYLLYTQEADGDSPPRTLVLSELVAATPEARRALISFAAAFDPTEFAVKYSVPRGEPLHPHLPSSFINARIEPGFMLRLVSVKGALGLLDLHAGLDIPLIIEVEDDVIPENAGEYVIGGNGVVRDADVEERVALDVRQLAQLYAGYLSARQLLHQGKLRPNSAKALELLERFFPPSDPYVSSPDDF